MGLEGRSREDSSEVAQDTVIRHASRGVVEVGTEDYEKAVGKESHAQQKEDHPDGELADDPQPIDRHDGEYDPTNGGVVLVSFDLRQYAIDAGAVAEGEIGSLANALLVGFVPPVVEACGHSMARWFTRDPHIDDAPRERHHVSGVSPGPQAQGEGDI